MGQVNHPVTPGPSVEQLRRELARERHRRRYWRTLMSTVLSLVLLAALVAGGVLFFPVVQIQSDSMSPVLCAGDLAILLRGNDCRQGDIIAFHDGSKVLLRRVLALGGDTVDVGDGGVLLVGGRAVDGFFAGPQEEEAWEIDLPLTVPDGQVFVLGDSTDASVDSRGRTLGCVPKGQILGRAAVRIWPMDRMALLMGR